MLRMAIPNKGRLFDDTTRTLAEAGFAFDLHNRRLCTRIENFGMELLFTRADDIPVYLENGIVDLGITGQDIVAEHGAEIRELLPLRYGRCRMVVAVPEGTRRRVEDLPRPCRVATSFPRIAEGFFAGRGIPVEIADIHGAVEISPRLGLADAIVDITSSGTTLAMNELEILESVMESEACLYANRKSLEARAEAVETVVASVQSVLAAHAKKYIMANVPAPAVDSIREILPAITAPTILNLSGCEEKVAVHSVINEQEVNDVVGKLRKIGGEGILVFNIERLFD